MTNTDNYYPPELDKNMFTCPHCGAFSHQIWSDIGYYNESQGTRWYVHNRKHCYCECCTKISIRKGDKMVYPLMTTAPLPHDDMPDDVKEVYEEAMLITQFSPRATSALLRVALEKLTVHLGENEGKLNTRIGNLKKKGLPEDVIKGLDIIRINANEGGAHAGCIDLTGQDNAETVNKLFWLINFIIEKTISDHKEVEEMFGNLPEDKVKGIQNRDS